MKTSLQLKKPPEKKSTTARICFRLGTGCGVVSLVGVGLFIAYVCGSPVPAQIVDAFGIEDPENFMRLSVAGMLMLPWIGFLKDRFIRAGR
jgi:hypothetical protein